MLKDNKVYCDRCGDRIYKDAYKVMDILMCNRCMKDAIKVDVKEFTKKGV